MKKLLSFMLVVCLLCGTTLNVSATSTDMNASEMSVPVTYDIQSSYSIYIPESIDMTNGEYVFEAAIIDILSDEMVVVECPDYVSMTSDDGKTGSLSLYSNEDSMYPSRVALFEAGNTTSTIIMRGQMDAQAGHYTGTATFKISLQNK